MRRLLAALFLALVAFGQTACETVTYDPPPGRDPREPPPQQPPPLPPPTTPPPADVAGLLARIEVGMTLDQASAAIGTMPSDKSALMAQWDLTIAGNRYLIFVNLGADGKVTRRDFTPITVIR